MTISLDSFDFSRRSDVVEENDVILIPSGSFVSTLAGNDLISSIYTTDTPTASLPTASGDSSEVVVGIYNQGSFDTSFGRDIIFGDTEYTGEPSISTYGILNRPNDGSNLAIISTGRGNDRVLGFANSSNSISIDGIGNLSSSEINTGKGNDEVRGEATGNATNLIAGISKGTISDATNLITTGNGNDKVIGKVNNGHSRFLKGIFQDGNNTQIITDNGNDKVIGEANGNAEFITGIDQEDGNNQITTGNGNDKIVGKASGNVSGVLSGIVQNRGSNEIITGNGNDKVIGKTDGELTIVSLREEDGQQLISAITGINQQFGTGSQKISTGNGIDEVKGIATGTATSNIGSLVPIVGITKLNSTIETGKGNDKVIGKASGTAGQIIGIIQQGSEDLIITENGNDQVIGRASGTTDDPNFAIMAGIAQQAGTAGSEIITGRGDDKVIGTADNNGQGLTAGILGDLDIVTGKGDDKVIASAKLFDTRVDGFAADPITGGTVTVDTGSGNDLVKGFGQGNFDGGKGRDIYDLSEYHQSEFAIAIGTGTNNEVNFTLTDDLLGERTASTQGFEVFRFANGQLSFSDLA